EAQPQAQGHLVAQVVAVPEPHADVSGDPRLFQSLFFCPPYRSRGALSLGHDGPGLSFPVNCK
ncbi:hypothetical protein A2U01_0119117, partial [Trifolium medium]|nr:hypothetical protein [Trifolium medium]